MNTLSILLYLSEVVYSLASVSITWLILFWLGYFIYTSSQKIWADGIYYDDDPELVKKKKSELLEMLGDDGDGRLSKAELVELIVNKLKK